MKAGLARQIAVRLGQPLDKRDWTFVRGRWMRRTGRWVQLLGINPSRFDDVFEIYTSLEYLPIPDPDDALVGGIAVRAVVESNGTQRMISAAAYLRDPSGAWHDVRQQLRPAVTTGLVASVAEDVAAADRSWPSIFARFHAALEAGDLLRAARIRQDFGDFAMGRPLDEQRADLESYWALRDDHAALVRRSDEVQEAKLSRLKGRPLG